MDTQNTPVHVRLWHRGFWLLAIANLLLCMAVYMLLPVLPSWLATQGFTPKGVAAVMSVYGAGMFLAGPFCGYWVQHYRRNQVCILAVLAMVALVGVIYYVGVESGLYADLSLMLLQRFALGACFGLAQMVLTSTLVIDTSESYQRTEANHAAAWFGRFALSLGPLAGLLLMRVAGFESVLIAAGALATAALILIALVDFPFRAPQDDIPTVSLDRFFLPHGFPLFLNLQLIMLAVGLLFSLALTEQFYAMMMVGFLLAILAQRFVFCDAEVKSEVVTGLILMGAALLMMLTRTQQIVGYAAPAFIGFGLGIIGSRFLLFFIKLSRHCKRGTSQSTFMLGWESGIAWGIGLGYALFEGASTPILLTALGLVLASLLLYNFVHNWFVSNKNR